MRTHQFLKTKVSFTFRYLWDLRGRRNLPYQGRHVHHNLSLLNSRPFCMHVADKTPLEIVFADTNNSRIGCWIGSDRMRVAAFSSLPRRRYWHHQSWYLWPPIYRMTVAVVTPQSRHQVRRRLE